LVDDPKALGKVAREALALMHFKKVDEAITAGDAKLLTDHDGEACVRAAIAACFPISTSLITN
jgi:hypothetical protein